MSVGGVGLYSNIMRKNYILDANILLHDPASILHFADNTVIIPVAVVEEIDRFKKEMTERGFNARAVARMLDSLRGERSFASGIPLSNGGTLRVHCDAEAAFSPTPRNGDLEVLRTARAVQQDDPETPAIIVTKDINLRIRADASGLRAEDYESDHVRLSELESRTPEYALDEQDISRFDGGGEIDCPNGSCQSGDYVVLRGDGERKSSRLARVAPDGKRLLRLAIPDQPICGIRPRNKEQYFALDALMNDDVQLVTLMGKAGTGKTLLAMAVALHKALVERQYRGVLVARPIVPLGRDMGYLPGEIERKLEPWMKPITDTVDFILSINEPITGEQGPLKSGFAGGRGPMRSGIAGCHDAAGLMRNGSIEIQPLAYIRGRNIANQFVVIDEAQNLTPLEVKTVITRIGQRAKVVLTGDPYQIDNPYVDASSNGFSYLINRFHNQPIAAHISLHKGERSPLAELAANLL